MYSLTDMQTMLTLLPKLSSMDQHIQQLSPELVAQVLSWTNVQMCALADNVWGMQKLLQRYLSCDWRSRQQDALMAKTCIAYRWAAGVQLLIDHGMMAPLLSNSAALHRVPLPALYLRRLWIAEQATPPKPHFPSDAPEVMVLVPCIYQHWRTTADDAMLRWCCLQREATFADLVGEHLRNQGTVEDLMRLHAAIYGARPFKGSLPLIVICAAGCDRMDVLEWVTANHPSVPTTSDDALRSAQRGRHRAPLRFILDQRMRPLTGLSLEEAVQEAPEAVARLLSRPLSGDPYAKNSPFWSFYNCATSFNQPSLLDCLVGDDTAHLDPALKQLVPYRDAMQIRRYHGRDRTGSAAIAEAVRKGDLDAARQAYNGLPETSAVETDEWRRLKRVAAAQGHLEMIRWLYSVCLDFSSAWSVVDLALHCDHRHIANYISDLMTDSPESQGTGLAVSQRRLRGVRWFLRSGQVSQAHLNVALGHGCLAVAKAIKSHLHNPMFGTLQLQAAVSSGYLHVVQWVHRRLQSTHETSVPLTAAATNGLLDIVQWLHQREQDVSLQEALESAAAAGQVHVVQYLMEQRPDLTINKAIMVATKGRRIDVLQYLHDKHPDRCQVDAISQAAAMGSLTMVRWLDSNGFATTTAKAMDAAAYAGALDVVRWLHENRTEGCTANALTLAQHKSGREELVAWLRANRPECQPAPVGAA
ncbi:hypothetical protein RI367_004880 [Sorochytrium milnesiophthora]